MTVRKVLFWAHLAAGSTAGLVILVLSITGVLLAFERQINDWSDTRTLLSAPATGVLPKAFEELESKDEKLAPTITVRSRSGAPLEFAYGRERAVFVNPFTGDTLRERSQGTRNFFGLVEKVHRALGGALRNSNGRTIVGASNAFFLFLVMSGLYLWFPRRWSIRSVRPALWFRGGLADRARDWNWHNTIGFWCSIPLFFIALSGVIMSYQWANNMLYQLTGTQPPPAVRGGEAPRDRQRSKGVERPGAFHTKSVAEILDTVERQTPDWKSITFQMPHASDRVITFSIDEGSGGQPQKRWQKTVDRTTAATVHLEGFDTLNAGRKLRTIARFLHTGEILGLPGQIIAALASAGAVVLVWTGLALALRRLYARVNRTGKLAASNIIARSESVR